MRRLITTDRDDRGGATVFIIVAITAVMIGVGFAIDVGQYVVAATIGTEHRRRNCPRSRDRLRPDRRTDWRLLALSQARPDHQRPGMRERRDHHHCDEGRRRIVPAAECGRRRPDRNGTVGNDRDSERAAHRHLRLRVLPSAARRFERHHRSTSTTPSRRAVARRSPADSASSTATVVPSRSRRAAPPPANRVGHSRRWCPASQTRAHRCFRTTC